MVEEMKFEPGYTLRPITQVHRLLGDLLSKFPLTDNGHVAGATFSGISITTEQVSSGDLFFAVQGRNAHGASYSADAVARGAVAIVTDEAGAQIIGATSVPILVCDNPRSLLGPISAWFFETAADTPMLIGVTGTNGKTSTVYFLEEILAQMGIRSGISSTTESRVAGISTLSRLTTPEACEMHALIARMRESEVKYGLIEVSAQAVTHGRIDSIKFASVGFSSFSQDHLDEYLDMETYFQAKRRLFALDHAERCVISIDSHWGKRLASEVEIPVVTLATGQYADADWRVELTGEFTDKTMFTLVGPNHQRLQTVVWVPSPHMASNAAMAVLLLVSAGVNFEQIKTTLESGPGIKVSPPGRMELVSNGRGPSVYVDAAHSPDAIKHTLAAVRRVTAGKLIALVGAGGDRDKSKRFEMGVETARNSDVVIVTDDNSRSEDPAEIRREVMRGVLSEAADSQVKELGQNAEAIAYAVSIASFGDTIVWLGPGSEHYREVGGVKTPFSARELARTTLADAGW